DAENLAVRARGLAGDLCVSDPEAKRAFAQDEAVSRRVEWREAARKRSIGGHHLEAIVRFVERLEDRIGAAGHEPRRAPLTNKIDGADHGREARRLFVADG